MFRGKQSQVLILVAAMLAAPALFAKDRGSLTDGKVVAPSLEHHADYFSEKRAVVSEANMKKADELRRKTITSIKALLKGKKKSVRRFELLLRLGELHVERHDHLRDQEIRAWEQAYTVWEKADKKKRGKEPKLSHANSRSALTRGANSFRTLVTEFPRHPRTDAALYSLAKTLARLGKGTAVNYYKQMIKSHPKSPLIADAYLALGEWYFDRHDVKNSIENYTKVLKFKEHRAYPYAVYKLGWAYYNNTPKNEKDARNNFKKAVTAFKLVVKLSERDKQRNKRNLDLREEAIRDLIVVWAEAEDINSAWAYFKTIGEKDSFYTMLERLGNIYADQGKNAKAITVFNRLLNEAPMRSGNPKIQQKLTELYDLSSKPDQIVSTLKKMHGMYLGRTSWTSKNPKDRADAKKLVEFNTHRWGATFHQRGQKQKSKVFMAAAETVYELYLKAFPKADNSYDIRYYLAEIKYDFKKYEEASKHYMIVAKAGAKKQYHKPAALNAVATLNQLVHGEKFGKLPPAGQVPKPIEVPRSKKLLISAIDQYVKMLPKEKDGNAMRFTAAKTLFDYGYYPDALKRFSDITKDIPGTKQSEASVKIVLGYHADRQDWTNLIAASRQFKGQKGLLDKKLNTYVVNLLRGAMFKQAMAFEKSGDHAKAADAFMKYQKEFPKDENADRSVYNATLSYYKIGAIEKALAASNLLLEQYPKSKTTPDVMALVAQTYESLASFGKAADYYKRFAITFPKDKRAPGALHNAAMLYKGTQKLGDASALFVRFQTTYKTHALASAANWEEAEIAESSKDWGKAVAAYEKFAKKYSKLKDDAYLARAKSAVIRHALLKNKSGMKDIIKLQKELSAKNAPVAYEARREVAEALFRNIEPDFATFKNLPIAGGAKIEKQVQAKQTRLVALAQSYEKIIDLGSAEYVVAALYRLGEAHENFSQALFKAPGPRGASQAELDAFKTELEKVAFPLREEAYKFFETAFKRSKEVQTFTVWTRRTYQKMVELAPERHPEVNEISADPKYLSHKITMDGAVAELAE